MDRRRTLDIFYYGESRSNGERVTGRLLPESGADKLKHIDLSYRKKFRFYSCCGVGNTSLDEQKMKGYDNFGMRRSVAAQRQCCQDSSHTIGKAREICIDSETQIRRLHYEKIRRQMDETN
ncbi:hypothetical protein KIN20_035362 [Parelaphostrongylus tenuis]|uniref:Uncharacterized protein n=1 Tax=Parelaphostrongylus tenuis TaxID=148309 RepID=A0AAD5RBI6_PARTN|nr:hypothetical protein KIN20_035362 [Parelaphostrongylus tenuis]